MACENAVVKIPMIAPIPVKAIPNFKPPSRDLESFLVKMKVIIARITVINGAAPKSIKGLNMVLAKSISEFILSSPW